MQTYCYDYILSDADLRQHILEYNIHILHETKVIISNITNCIKHFKFYILKHKCNHDLYVSDA